MPSLSRQHWRHQPSWRNEAPGKSGKPRLEKGSMLYTMYQHVVRNITWCYMICQNMFILSDDNIPIDSCCQNFGRNGMLLKFWRHFPEHAALSKTRRNWENVAVTENHTTFDSICFVCWPCRLVMGASLSTIWGLDATHFTAHMHLNSISCTCASKLQHITLSPHHLNQTSLPVLAPLKNQFFGRPGKHAAFTLKHAVITPKHAAIWNPENWGKAPSNMFSLSTCLAGRPKLFKEKKPDEIKWVLRRKTGKCIAGHAG